MAVAAFVCSLLVPPLGIIFGHSALGQIRRTGAEGRGFAVAGLVIGYVFTAVAVAVSVFWYMAVQSFVSALEADSRDDYSSTYYTTPSATRTFTPAGTPTTIPSSASRGTPTPWETSEAIRNAVVGSCIERTSGADNGDGTSEVFVTAVSCSSADATDRVQARSTDVNDCGTEWVRTTDPTVVLCLTPE